MTNNERPLILLTALFTIAFLFIIFYLIMPACYNADGLFLKLQEKEKRTAELATLQSYHGRVNEIREELDSLNKDKEGGLNWSAMRQKIAMNFTEDDPMFLPKIYFFFQQCQGNSSLTSISGSRAAAGRKEEKEEKEGLKENIFNLSLLSSYDDFKNFLIKLENQSLLVNVKEISFSSIASAQTKKGELSPKSMPFSLTVSVPSY